MHPLCKILHPPEKYKDGQFNSTLTQLSHKSHLFSYQIIESSKFFACCGLLHDDPYLASPYAPPLKILHPPEILP